jgi:hypothetical protein
MGDMLSIPPSHSSGLAQCHAALNTGLRHLPCCSTITMAPSVTPVTLCLTAFTRSMPPARVSHPHIYRRVNRWTVHVS